MFIDEVKIAITDKGMSLLTQRERQVLLSDAVGKSGKQTTKGLGVSPSAIAIYNERLTEKLKTRYRSINRSAMLIKAQAYGLMTVEQVDSSHELA